MAENGGIGERFGQPLLRLRPEQSQRSEAEVLKGWSADSRRDHSRAGILCLARSGTWRSGIWGARVYVPVDLLRAHGTGGAYGDVFDGLQEPHPSGTTAAADRASDRGETRDRLCPSGADSRRHIAGVHGAGYPRREGQDGIREASTIGHNRRRDVEEPASVVSSKRF